jgi:hypothetical protein
MIPFRTKNGAVFRCQIDPAWTTYANLNFFAGPDQIAFHLSLRLTQGFAVLNQKDRSGWDHEEQIAFAFPKHRFEVEIAFGAAGALIRMNGADVGQVRAKMRLDRQSRFFVRRRFADLNKITGCTVEGAVPWETVETRDNTFDRLWDAVHPTAGLVLTDRMELAERLPDSETAPRHALLLPGQPDPIALRPATTALPSVPNTFAVPKGIAAVLVPGRIWRDLGANDLALLRVIRLPDRQEVAALEVTRDDLARRLLRLLRAGALANDDLAALQAIEHTHHAALFPALDPELQSALKSAAARLGLTAFLSAPPLIPPQPHAADPPPKPAPDKAAADLAALMADLARAMTRDPSKEALTRWLPPALADHPSLDTERLALSLCPVFCEHDSFEVLFHAIQARGLPVIRPWDDVGYVSLTLPFQLLDGQHDAVISRLNWLAERHGGWLVTAALGWIARRLAVPGALSPPDAKRHQMISGFCAVLRAQAQDPWGRAACHQLMDGLLALLAQLHRLPPDLRVQISATALAAYGLSPRFWDQLGEHCSDRHLSAHAPDVLAARGAFRSVQSAQGEAHQTANALATLAALGADGVKSAALGLLPVTTLRKLAAWHDDLHLRDLFAPGAETDPDFDVRSAITRSEAHLTRDPTPSAYEGLERALGEAAFDLLSRWHELATDARQTRLRDCLADALALSGADAGHIGLWVSLALGRALSKDAEACDQILRHLEQVRNADPVPLRDLARFPALRDALHGLAADPALAAQVHGTLGLPPQTSAQRLPQGPLSPADALFNTVVLVFSCHPNLTTRIPAMRQGWLSDLIRLGIPYVVVVGRTDAPSPAAGEEDVVTLNAPDDYEGLPQKTLAAMAFVRQRFPGRRVLKIDDDCFLHVEEFFYSLSFLRADYYGRPLARARGQMDRTWHMGKSTSARGRFELDKSPEPSRYADGGSGYMLSPAALEALLTAADTAEGQRLVQASFMEDKMVGDLLAFSGIAVSGKDYRVHVLRRAHPGAIAVPKWQNTCLPFLGSGIKLAHLDGHDLQDKAASVARSRRPASAKVWSTLAPARLGAQSNALDLISPTARLHAASKADVAVVACFRNEMFLLPRFLEHYRALGVTSFLIADNGSEDGTLEFLAEQPDVALFSVDSDYNQSHYGVVWQQALMAAYRPDRWALVADADELLVWTAQATGNLPDLLRDKDFEGHDAARVFMLDMYPGGALSDTDFKIAPPFVAAPFTDRDPFLTTSLGRGPFSNARTWTSATRHRLLPGSRAELFVAQKIALLRYRPWMRLSDGLHYVAETRLSPRALLFGHFKYNAAFREKAVTEVSRGQHFNNSEEYRKYLDLIAEGRETLFDPSTSVHWTQSDFVRAVLATGRIPPAG